MEAAEWSGEYGFSFAGTIRDEYEMKWEKLAYKEKKRDVEHDQNVVFEVEEGKLVRLPELIERVRQSNPKHLHPALTSSKRAFYLSEAAAISAPAQAVRDFLANMNFYDVSPERLRYPQKAVHPFPLSEKGENLAATLRELKLKERSDAIVEPLALLAEGVNDYSVQTVGGFLVTKLHYTLQNGNLQEIDSDLSYESDGTLRLLSILAALYQQRFPSPLAIEEPEKAIYPGVLELLYYALEEVACTYQVLVTTQSADLLTSFPAETLRVVEKVNGYTKIGPISDHQYKSIAENIFSAGALLRGCRESDLR